MEEEQHNEQICSIEDFNGTINLVTDEDGNVKVFDNRADAYEEKDKCQHGVVVYLGKV